MSSIISYRVEKDEFSHPFLVAEKTIEYGSSKVAEPEDAVNIANNVFRMNHLAEEMVCMISLSSAGKVLGMFNVSHGTIDRAVCNPREIFLRALVSGASTIVILHNHPSGDPTPSDIDLGVCKRLSEVSKIMGIALNDFIVIGDTYYSFREQREQCLE